MHWWRIWLEGAVWKEKKLVHAIHLTKSKLMVEIEDYGCRGHFHRSSRIGQDLIISTGAWETWTSSTQHRRGNQKFICMMKKLETKKPMKSAAFVGTTWKRIWTCARWITSPIHQSIYPSLTIARARTSQSWYSSIKHWWLKMYQISSRPGSSCSSSQVTVTTQVMSAQASAEGFCCTRMCSLLK